MTCAVNLVGTIWKKARVYVMVKNAMSTKKKTRNTLTLKKKCELIEFASNNPQLSSRTLAEKFGCGKTQVIKILSKKESLVVQYESNVSKDCVLLSKRCRPCEFAEINESLYKWQLYP